MRIVNKPKQISGFTLAELLVVVAIIGILVAVSIPIFNEQLEKSREASDIANLRAAKAAAIAAVISGQIESGTAIQQQIDYWYNIETGKYQTAPLSKGYGKGTAQGNYYYSTGDKGSHCNNEYGYNSNTAYEDGCIEMSYEIIDGLKTIRIYFKQYYKKYNQGGYPDDWKNATVIYA
jgi:prepilin-type N-terminal cleavage/methylation domain-containing protein